MNKVFSRYSQASLFDRLFVRGRSLLTDFNLLERYVPKSGKIIDLGCGHGLFANLLVETEPNRQVLGIDLDKRKITVAKKTVGNRTNLSFKVGDITKFTISKCEVVTIVDVFYLLSPEKQEKVLRQVYQSLTSGGLLLIKAQEKRFSWRYGITYLQEFLSISLGFTESEGRKFYFPTREESLALFERCNFEVRVVEMPGRIYSDVIYLARPG